jgi:hypothetical protein
MLLFLDFKANIGFYHINSPHKWADEFPGCPGGWMLAKPCILPEGAKTNACHHP